MAKSRGCSSWHPISGVRRAQQQRERDTPCSWTRPVTQCGLRAVGGGRAVGAVQQWFAAGALAWQSKAGVCAIGGPAALRAALEAAG